MKKNIIFLSLFIQIIISKGYNLNHRENNENNNFRHLDYFNESDPELTSCLVHNETIDSSLYEVEEQTCNQHILGDENYRCCYISHRVGKDYSNQFCQVIAYTANAIGDVKSSYSHSQDLKILCDGFFLKFNFILFSFIYFIF